MEMTRGLFLIIDDEPALCLLLEHLLRQEGCATKTARSGCEALGLVKRFRFRLAFMDVKLPDADGIDLAGRLRELDPGLPIMLVSGSLSEDDVDLQKALADGLICGFIRKPYKHEEIRNATGCGRLH